MVVQQIVDRDTRDLDAFIAATPGPTPGTVDLLADAFTAAAQQAGWSLQTIRRHPTFCRFILERDDGTAELDLAVDSPLLEPPGEVDGIPVLTPLDLAARKVLAVVDRLEARDYTVTERYDVRWRVQLCSGRLWTRLRAVLRWWQTEGITNAGLTTRRGVIRGTSIPTLGDDEPVPDEREMWPSCVSVGLWRDCWEEGGHLVDPRPVRGSADLADQLRSFKPIEIAGQRPGTGLRVLDGQLGSEPDQLATADAPIGGQSKHEVCLPVAGLSGCELAHHVVDEVDPGDRELLLPHSCDLTSDAIHEAFDRIGDEPNDVPARLACLVELSVIAVTRQVVVVRQQVGCRERHLA